MMPLGGSGGGGLGLMGGAMGMDPGSGLGGTGRLDSTLFDRMPRYLECTYLAIRFSLTGRLRFLDAPTVVWTEYGGLSQSPAFRVGQPAALEAMLARAANDGVYQTYSGPYDPGDWRNIKAKLLSDPAWQQHWHSFSETPWLFHPADRIFVSYEDPKSISIRANLAKDIGIRGVFTWEITGDDDQQSLLEAMAQPFDEKTMWR